jgi:hypothetical protein
MQDFDFDEIDRAVNSTLDPTTPTEPTPTDNSVPVSVSRSEPASQAPAPAARRSSGRFMDVVHPSSDMRSAPPERSEPRKPEAPAPTAPPVVNSSDWPDPLDFHGFKDEPKEADEPEVQKTEEPATPLESPFLSDAKVEKRPLGAFSTDDEPKEAPIEEPKKDEIPLLEASDEPLLEAENEEKAPQQPETESTPEPTQEPTPAPVVEEEPVGPTSITQQYKEQPSTTEQPSGAIFDTEAYHQPLAHPVKKKSGALIIVWILALIVVGAGVGAGVYFFVLPSL